MNTFTYLDKNLRTLTIDGEPWFVAADVCNILGLSNATNAVRPLGQDERSTVNRIKVGMRGGAPALIISESGLYKLIMRSDKAEAREFQEWVTREVLPSIRKTGGYLLNEAARETAHADTRTEMPLPEAVAAAFEFIKAELAQLKADNSVLRDQLRDVVDPVHVDQSGKAQRVSEMAEPHLRRALNCKHVPDAMKIAMGARLNVLRVEQAKMKAARRAEAEAAVAAIRAKAEAQCKALLAKANA